MSYTTQCNLPSLDKLILEVSSQGHKDLILKRNKIVVVEIYGVYCSACKAISPVYGRLACKYSKHILFVKEDADKNLTDGISEVPTFQIFRDGKLIKSSNFKNLENNLKPIIHNLPVNVRERQLATDASNSYLVYRKQNPAIFPN